MMHARLEAPRDPMGRASSLLWEGVAPGAMAGLIGGVAFGASMIELGVLQSIGSLVRAGSPVVGFLVHMSIAALVGAAFGVLVWHQRVAAGATLVWGLAYGSFFWFVGPITLRPLILGEPVSWDVGAAHGAFASLIGHVVWGAVTGVSLAAIRGVLARSRSGRVDGRRESEQSGRAGALVAAAGALAGMAASAVLTAPLSARNELTAAVSGGDPTNWPASLAVGALVGVVYAVLYPRLGRAGGPRLVQGMALGYLAWIAVGLTIVPLQQTGTLAWSAALAVDRFETLPGYLLFGALAALLYQWITAARFLFSDEVRRPERLTGGPQRLRAAGRGAMAGVGGGLLFTIVMVQVGALGRVSRLVGAESPVVGFLVHMGIAVVVGVTYGLLFRRQSFDVRSGMGWGVAYGFLWWNVGSLTLLPVFLGGSPLWHAQAAASAVPALVGHLAYGMGLGVVFYLLEARYSPWWITRSEAEAQRTRELREQVLTSAPALWAFVVFLALFVPTLLAAAAPTAPGP